MPAGISDFVLAAKMGYHYIEADADLPTRTVDRPVINAVGEKCTDFDAETVLWP